MKAAAMSEMEKAQFTANLRQNLGYTVSPIIAAALTDHIEVIVAAHVKAALIEVEDRISSSVSPNFGMRHDGTVDRMAEAYVEGLRDAHDTVRAYRNGAA